MANAVKRNVKSFLVHLNRTAYFTVPLELTFTIKAKSFKSLNKITDLKISNLNTSKVEHPL